MKLKYRKKSQKQGRILEGGGGGKFSGWPDYIPLGINVSSDELLCYLHSRAAGVNVDSDLGKTSQFLNTK